MSESPKLFDRSALDLGKKLKAAYVSHGLGITLAYAYRAYTKDDEEIDPYWVDLAKKVISDGLAARRAMWERASAVKPPEGEQGK